MAVTKIWTIKDSLQRVLDYAANPDKTEYDALAQTLHYAENDAKTKLNESAQLVTGIHCRADHAWEDMRAVQERFGKTDGVVALHAYQSFREGEVTPEQCHEIGVALARKVWGKRFQVLVATHMNTDNLHNHFVINSVSYVDGKKYEQRRSQYAEFRAASDKLCREYGLSVVEQPKTKEPARYARMREAIDQACEDASTAEDFHRALYQQGYIFGSDPNRKYATIRARDGGRAVRLYRLGEEYDLTAIDDRLRGNYLLYGSRLYELKNPPRQNTPKRYRPKDAYAGKGILQIFFEVFFGESQMHRLYLYYCYQLGILPKKQQPRISRPELERIWKDTEKILAEHAFVHDHIPRQQRRTERCIECYASLRPTSRIDFPCHPSAVCAAFSRKTHGLLLFANRSTCSCPVLARFCEYPVRRVGMWSQPASSVQHQPPNAQCTLPA